MAGDNLVSGVDSLADRLEDQWLEEGTDEQADGDPGGTKPDMDED